MKITQLEYEIDKCIRTINNKSTIIIPLKDLLENTINVKVSCLFFQIKNELHLSHYSSLGVHGTN